MIFKIKNKKKNNKKISSFFDLIKNLFSIIFLVQIFFIVILLIWYFNNPVKNFYPPERLYKIFSTKTKNFIGLDFQNITQYPKIYFDHLFFF